MGLILDSSVVIDAERCDETVARLIERIIGLTKDQEAALSAVGLTELVHGIYRGKLRVEYGSTAWKHGFFGQRRRSLRLHERRCAGGTRQ